jgi:serine/threonine-protein kinase mTOR
MTGTCIANVSLNRLALETVEKFTESLDVTEYASRIIHPLVRTLDNTAELRPVAMSTLTMVAQQLNRQYLMFIPLVSRIVVKHRLQYPPYELLVSRLLSVSLISSGLLWFLHLLILLSFEIQMIISYC